MASKKKSKSTQSVSGVNYGGTSGDYGQEPFRADDLSTLPRLGEVSHRQQPSSGEYGYAAHEGIPHESNVRAEYPLYDSMSKDLQRRGRVKSREKKSHREADSGFGSHCYSQHGTEIENDQPISLVIHGRTYEQDPQPSTSASSNLPTEKKREQTCRFCYNHGKIFPKKNHKYQCQHIDCDCQRCKVTRDSQKSMRDHQRQTRHQKTEYLVAPLAVAALPGHVEGPQIWEFPESRRKEFEPILTEDCSDLIEKVEELCKKAKKH